MSNDVGLERIVRGYRSKIHEPSTYVVQTTEEWEKLHQNLQGKKPAVEYNFSEITLLAVCLGKVGEGSAVKITRVSDIGDKVQVEVQRNIQGGIGWCPYDIVRIAKATKNICFEYQDNPNLPVSDVRPQ